MKKTFMGVRLRRLRAERGMSQVAMAQALGYPSKAAFDNRLYRVKGQRFAIDDAMDMQIISGRTDFAEADPALVVRTLSGGLDRPWAVYEHEQQKESIAS